MVVRNDDPDRDRRGSDAQGCDRRPRGSPPPRHGVPDAEAGDHERDLLLRRRREKGEDGEGQQAALVQGPEGIQEQRAGKGDGVELVQRQPLRRW